MKIWKFPLRKSSGVNNTLRQSLSLQSFSVENLWEIETLQFKPGDHQRGSTTKTSTSSPSLCASLPASSSVSPWSPTTSYFRTPPGFLDSPRPTPLEIFLQGHMEVDRNGKWVLAEPTTETVSDWDEVISSCRITLFSDFPWKSNTWLSIRGFTCLNQ